MSPKTPADITANLLVLTLVATLGVTGCGENETPQAQRDDYQPETVEQLDCVPDLDGRIDADQLQPAFDIPVNYRMSPAGHERPVDLAGYEDQTGKRIWNLESEEYELADENLEIVATEIDDRWYADDFPDAGFVTLLDAATETEAVYSHDGDTLFLHGYASARQDPEIGKTLVAYEEPVVAFDFPLEEGKSWSGTGIVHNATVRDLPYTAEEHYEFEVDASGELWLPDINFDQVLRMRTSVTIDAAVGNPIYRQQVQYLFECFGEVARLVGPDKEVVDPEDFDEDDREVREGNERQDYDFDIAVEMRRMGF